MIINDSNQIHATYMETMIEWIKYHGTWWQTWILEPQRFIWGFP